MHGTRLRPIGGHKRTGKNSSLKRRIYNTYRQNQHMRAKAVNAEWDQQRVQKLQKAWKEVQEGRMRLADYQSMLVKMYPSMRKLG